MRVIVTGAAGFIGSALVRRLLGRGEEVCAVVRPGSKSLGRLLGLEPGPGPGRMVLCEWNLHDIGRLPAGLTQTDWGSEAADAWVHIGWEGAGNENRGKRDVQWANIAQSLAAVEAAAALGCGRFLFTGSQAEYGIYHERLYEDMPCRPVSEYGKAKADFAAKAKILCGSLEMDFVHTRIFSVYGPGDHPWSLVNSCLRTWRAGGCMRLGECTQQWNFLYIDDAARALCHLLDEGRAGIYNVAGEDTRPLRSYIEEMYALCGGQGSYVYGERPYHAEGPVDLIPDITRICQDTTWRPRVSFAQGIRWMLEE